MWYLFPVILIVVVVILGFITKIVDWARWPCFITLFVFVVAVMICPMTYFEKLGEIKKMDAYYTNIIEPNIIEDLGDRYIVSNLEAGVWQSGESNLGSYNSTLALFKWQKTLPIIQWVVPDIPSYLKTAGGQ